MAAIARAKKQSKEELSAIQRKMTANDFINVKDIRGNYLYGKDSVIFAYLKVQPVSLELLSTAEKRKRISSFSAEFSSEKRGFKLFAIARPVDISGVTGNLQTILASAVEMPQKLLLYNEMETLSGFALGGEVIERQFYVIFWMEKDSVEQPEVFLMNRATEMQNKFRSCDVHTELAGQDMIIQLCNHFANPNYFYFEDTDYLPVVPFLGGV